MLQKTIQNIKKIKNIDNLFIYFLLFLLVFLSRIPFMSKFLFEWDSIQLALGMNHFSIVQHQPQPPGYFFYIYSSKLINIFLHNQNYSMIIINIFLAFIATVLFYKFCFKIFRNKIISFLLALIVVTNPYAWFHSEFANVYMSDFAFALIFFYFAYEIIVEKKNKILLFSLFFAIGSGFRQSLFLFFLPVYVFAFFVNLKNYKKYLETIALNFVIFIIPVLIWLIPTIISSGGPKIFYQNTLNQYTSTTSVTSIFHYSNLSKILSQAFNTLKLLAYSSSLLFLLTLYFILFKKFKFIKNIKILFYLWFFPSFLFFSIIHLGKIGYIMTLTPLILVLGACVIYRIKKIEYQYLIIFIIIIFQIICFFTDFSLLRNNESIKHLLINIQPYEVGKFAIEKNDIRINEILDLIKQYDPNETILISEAGSPYVNWRKNYIKNFRLLDYYFPNYRNFYLYNDMKQFREDYNFYSKIINSNEIKIPSNTKNFVLVSDGHPTRYNFKEIQSGSEKIYFYDLSSTSSFEYINFYFIKED